MSVVDLSLTTFDAWVRQPGTVIVNVSATWHSACQLFVPVYREAARAFTDVTFCGVDTDREEQLVSDLQITSIPTLLVYRDGVLVHGSTGCLGSAELFELIEGTKNLDASTIMQRVQND